MAQLIGRDNKGRFVKGNPNPNRGTHQWFTCAQCCVQFYPLDTVKRKYCPDCKLLIKKGDRNYFYGKSLVPWNKGKKGLQKHTPESLAKIVSKTTGKRRTPEQLQKLRGANHYNWKGGITTHDRQERIRFQRTMQKAVFERDSYKCQICSSNGDLQVDHIKSWADFPGLRFVLDNCRTLCAKCHYRITFNREMPRSVKGWGHNLLKIGGSP